MNHRRAAMNPFSIHQDQRKRRQNKPPLAFLLSRQCTSVALLFGALIHSSCSTTEPPAKPSLSAEIHLPDLVIKRVSYRFPPSAPRITPLIGGIIEPTYEFLIQVENIGNAPFAEPFMISYTTNILDFQNLIFSRQERFNEERTIIAPGKSRTFSLITPVQIHRSTMRLTTLPIRFLINYDWRSYSSRPQTGPPRELNYDNNSFELSMRVQVRY